MLEVIGSSLIGLLMEILGIQPTQLEAVQQLSWQEVKFFDLPSEPDLAAEAVLQQYLKGLSRQGVVTANQGVWVQSELTRLATHQGTEPISAASLTKIATTLAALEKWEPEHQFETRISATGPIKNGVLQGDLVISGSGDPLFVWEEAIALGNALNQLGIRKVTGNLVINGDFYMNYESDPAVAGQLLKQGLNESNWLPVVIAQYLNLPPGTPALKSKLSGLSKLKKA